MFSCFYCEENYQSKVSCCTAVSAEIQGSFCIKLPEEYQPIYELSQEMRSEIVFTACRSVTEWLTVPRARTRMEIFAPAGDVRGTA